MFELDMLSYLMGKKAGGSAVEQVEKAVALDFSDGDMKVLPNEGEAFSEVTVEQPENLIPDNIAEGVNIAGIVGALAAGGGGEFICAEVDFASDSYGRAYTVTHNLGVVPCFAMVACKSLSSAKTSDTYLYAVAGISTELNTKLGLSKPMIVVYYNNYSGYTRVSADSDCIDETSIALYNATETEITVGTYGTRPLIPSTTYHAVVIGYKTES